MPSTTAALQAYPKTAIQPRRRGRPREDEKPVPATPETKLKLRFNHIQVLADEPRTQPLAVAAAHISSAHHTIFRITLVSASSYEPRVDGMREADDYPPKMIPLVLRYNAWRKEIPRRKGLHLPAIFAMIVDGMAPSEADRIYCWKEGTAANMLLEALDIYCRMGNWG